MKTAPNKFRLHWRDGYMSISSILPARWVGCWRQILCWEKFGLRGCRWYKYMNCLMVGLKQDFTLYKLLLSGSDQWLLIGLSIYHILVRIIKEVKAGLSISPHHPRWSDPGQYGHLLPDWQACYDSLLGYVDRSISISKLAEIHLTLIYQVWFTWLTQPGTFLGLSKGRPEFSARGHTQLLGEVSVTSLEEEIEDTLHNSGSLATYY